MPVKLHTRLILLLASAAVLLSAAAFDAAEPIHYTITVPQPQHRWMQVEATFPDVPAGTLELRMSRSSPGRYSLHDFAKNVHDVHAFGADGREIPTTRPDPYGWNVSGHGGRVTVTYRVYGDRVDGTYLAVDTTHVHMNMPAAIMWAHGLEDRPDTLTFVPPAATDWRVATQLHPGATPFEFTAPNLEYLMDSPAEFGPVAMREFSVGSSRFRFSLHHTGTDAELDAYARDVEKIVQQEGKIYGEFPAYEPGYYTFLADYLPYANGDGMEHRNSTVMTAAGSIGHDRLRLLDTVAHEFFHCWNVERIRPRGLEPFDFDRANMTDDLWLAEGFTQYYGPLVLHRAGLTGLGAFADTLAGLIDTVTVSSGRTVRSAVEMSRMAPFIDGGRTVDRTDWSRTVISYYPFGAAIAMAMDLSLRQRSHGQVTLDDFMRAMWRRFGKPGGTREGYVDHPYSIADAETTLAEVSGDRAFAHDFFARYIEGHDVADYARLLADAGLTVRPRRPAAAWWGNVGLDFDAGAARVTTLVPFDTPAYAAGLEQDDTIRELDGTSIGSSDELGAVFARHKPGDRVSIAFVDRTGAATKATLTFAADPAVDVVPAEAAGGSLTPAQRAFRDGWLNPRP